MSRSLRAVVGLAAAVCLLFAATLTDVSRRALWLPQDLAPALPPDLDRSASLEVAVTDADGKPAEGALVRVFTVLDDQVYSAGGGRTGADGRARIDRLVPGETWVVVQQLGRARTSEQLVLEPGERALALELGKAASFEVVVVDPLQRPILDVQVSLYSADPLPFVTRTDRRGLARFEGLPAGPYTVEVSAPGYDQKLVDDLHVGDSPLFVKLERLGGLEVQVVEPTGVPAAGATVLVAGASLWPARSAVTDETGRVVISGLPRGFYDVRAERDALVSDTEAGIMLEQGEHAELTVYLLHGSFVTVRVTDGEGEDAEPIGDADVALVENGISSFPLYGRTAEDGTVRLGPIVGDGATVSARAEGYVARSVVPVEEGQTEVQVALQRGGVIVGRVVDDKGFPIAGATLEAVGVDEGGLPIVDSSTLSSFRDDHFAFALPGATPLIPSGELGVMPIVPDVPRGQGTPKVQRTERRVDPWMSDRRGEFSISPITPGRVRVVAHHPGFVEGDTEPFEIRSGEEVEVEIVMKRGGVLEGRVVEEDGSPVPGARIEVDSPTAALGRVTYTADDGTFAVAALPHRVTLSVARAESIEHVVTRETFEVPPDERREVEIVLPEPRDPVDVRVVDDRGFPVEDVEIHASSLTSDETLVKTLFSDTEGEAILYGARGLPLRFTTRKRGHAPTVLEIERAPRSVELVVLPPVTLRGSVESVDGFVHGAEITLMTPTGGRTTRSREEGVFRVEDLAPTPTRLSIVAEGYVPAELDLELDAEPGEEVDLGPIELTEGGGLGGRVVDERGDPIAGVRLALGRVPTYLPLGQLPPGIAQTDRSGRFTLPDLPPGNATLQAYKVGYERAEMAVTVRAGEVREGIELELLRVDAPPRRAEASLAVTLSESMVDGLPVVVFEHVPYGGEAQRAGILAGDRFVAYGGTPIRSLEQARRSLDGPKGQDMVIELGRGPDLRWRVRVRRERLRR